jgi:serine/threonine-protein kinase
MWNLTPEFASPEQIKGEPITTKSDVYSLGIILYRLLTGHSPYKIKSLFQSDISKIITQKEPTKPSEIIFQTVGKSSDDEKSEINPESISKTREGSVEKLHKKLVGDIDNIVSMAIRKETDRRYSSVELFAVDINRYLNDLPVNAHKDSLRYRSMKFFIRNKFAVISAAIIFIIINIGLAGILWQGYIAAKERDIATLEADKSNRIKSFLLDMISAPDPVKEGNEVKVIDVIKNASQKLSNELKDYPQIEAEIRTMLANTYQNLGVYDSAETELLKSHLITKKVFGNRSVETAGSLKSLALIYHYQGDYEKAEKYFTESLTMLRSIETTPSFQTALILDAYGTFVADQGDMEKSEKLTEEALKIAESLKGSEDHEVALIKNNLATSYHSLNKLDEAEKLYHESLRVFRKHFGNYHLRVSSSLNNLAFIHIYKEDHQKALPLLKESLEIKRTILGENHPDLIQSYSNVGSAYFNLNDFDNAEKFMITSIDVGLKNYDSENISLSRTYMWYGRVLDGMKNFKKSVYYLEKSYLIRKRELGPKNKLALSCQSLLGQTYLNSGNYLEAEHHLIESYNGLKEVTKNESESIQKTLESIVELYNKLGQKDRAAIYSKSIIDKKNWTKP